MIDEEKGSVSVYNNGRGIPVQMHKEYNMYVPELIFGNLLTSSNYDDKEKKTTGKSTYFTDFTNPISPSKLTRISLILIMFQMTLLALMNILIRMTLPSLTKGGRNGYGAKLANIFSKEFTVETQDSKQGLVGAAGAAGQEG